MKKKKSNSNIKCDVRGCKNNNFQEGTCCLEKVNISCSCDNDHCNDSLETICQSFKATGSKINDNEYEVDCED